MTDQLAQPTEGLTPEEDGHIRPGGLVLTIVVSLVVFVGIGVLFHSLTYKSPSGTEVAQSAGTAVVNGRVIPHVTLRFQAYPDASGFVNGVADPSQRQLGVARLRPDQRVPGPRPLSGHRQRPPIRLGRCAQQPVVRHRPGHGRRDGRSQRQAGHLDRPQQRRAYLHRAGHPRDRSRVLPQRPPAGGPGGNNQADNGQYDTVVFSFVSGSKGTYAWNCEFPCGTMVASFGGPMGAYGYMSGFVHVV